MTWSPVMKLLAPRLSLLILAGPVLPGIMVLCCKAGDPVAVCAWVWHLFRKTLSAGCNFHVPVSWLGGQLGVSSEFFHNSQLLPHVECTIQHSTVTLTHFVPSSFLVLCHWIDSVLSAPLLHSVTHQTGWEMFRGLFNWIKGQFLSSWY